MNVNFLFPLYDSAYKNEVLMLMIFARMMKVLVRKLRKMYLKQKKKVMKKYFAEFLFHLYVFHDIANTLPHHEKEEDTHEKNFDEDFFCSVNTVAVPTQNQSDEKVEVEMQ